MTEKASPVLGIIASKFTTKGPEPEFVIPPDLDPTISTTISIKAISTMAGESDEAKEAISVLPFSNIKANGLVYFYKVTAATERGGTVFASLTILIHESDASFLYHNIAKLKDLLSEKGELIRGGAPANIVCTELFEEINEMAKYESSSRQILLEYGLDVEETDAYFYMVNRGPVGVGEMGIRLQIDREHTEKIMKKLQEKGLIQGIPGKKLIYQALPPYRAILNQLNTFIPYIRQARETIPNSTTDINQLNKQYLSTLAEMETQIKKTLTVMDALFKSSKNKITFKFKNLWFVDGTEAIIAEITDIMWKTKIRLYIVAPTIEDVNLAIIKNLPKKILIRLACYLDFNNPKHLKIATELSNHNINFRLYKKRNLWGINRDQEEIILGTVSEDGDVNAVASDNQEHVQLFSPILETAWIQGKPLDLNNLVVKPSIASYKKVGKGEFEKIETESPKLPTYPKSTPTVQLKTTKGFTSPIVAPQESKPQKNIFKGMTKGFQKVEEEKEENKKKKKFWKIER
ncbi:MAG: helix-turn-helix domain-containing protein [Candidatus Helarchaeota archaeon]